MPSTPCPTPLEPQFLALYLPRLPTDRLKRSDARHEPGPLALYAKQGSAFALTAVDARAQALGLKPGLALADARAMQPHLAVREAEEAEDAALLDRIARWCERYTPVVALDPPYGLFLDVTGCTHLFDGPEALRRDIVARLERQGFAARAAVAPTPGAAWALARFGAPGNTTRHGEPGVVEAGTLRATIAPLPVAALRLAPDAAALLKRLGLTRIGQVMDAPRQPFAARAGQQAMRRLDQALGRAPEALAPRRPPPPVFALRRLVEPILSVDAVLTVAEVLCADLCAALDNRGLGAMTLRLSLFGVDDRVRQVDLGFSRPESKAAPMLRLFREKLGAAPELLDAEFGFDALRLDVGETAPMTMRAADLAPTAARDGETEARILDRMVARLGERRVGRIAPRPVHAPERSNTWMTATGSAPAPMPHRAPQDGVMRRPLRLFPRAHKIEVMASVPDGPPLRFRWRRLSHEIVRAEGPERISPHWLRAADTRTRDYYRIEDRGGRRFWVYRDGPFGGERPPDWFLHGLFA